MLNKTTNDIKICFIGGGNMAGALIAGLLDKSDDVLCEPADIHVVDVNADRLTSLRGQFGVTTGLEIDDRVSTADVILLSVKPQQMREVAERLSPFLNAQLLLSIAAGIRCKDLSRWLNNYGAVVRTMPNMPALINRGITGMVAAAAVTEEQKTLAQSIMSAAGATIWLEDEAMLDPLTAISGSGPAYVFYFMEAMQRAAEEMGFDREQARLLTLATFQGAVQLVEQSEESVAVLRERVTSKGGTTYAALSSMEGSGVGEAIVEALKAASRRSKELGDEFGR